MAINLTHIAEALTSSWNVPPEIAHSISFHIGDAYEDWKNLVGLLEGAESVDNEALLGEIHSMLTHTPNHLIAAAKLLNIPVEDTWDVGVKIQDGHLPN